MKEPVNKKTKWSSYSELAWIESIVAPPEEYAEATELFCKIIKKQSEIEPRTLLHPGCGAGRNDFIFKKHFKVTGVDISEDMLKIAKKLNPEVTYYKNDMRTLKMDECFDAVAMPDSLEYMVTVKDLKKAIFTAHRHLRPGGIFLFVAYIKEEFVENNFINTGSIKDTEITVFENNYIPDPTGNTYEATMIYLIRKKGKLTIQYDSHILGLFKLEVWLDILKEFDFEIKQIKMEHLFGRSILGEGKYPLLVFICKKPLM